MSRLVLAIRLFFRVLFDRETARRGARILEPAGDAAAAVTPSPAATAAKTSEPSTRSDALSLLAVLQREARLIDFLKEDISGYADAQVGAAARDVHRDAAAAIERLFALRPVIDQPEGARVSLPAPGDAARMRIVGEIGSAAPASGQLRHAGWQAAKVELPRFTGTAESARIIAPAEVEANRSK